MPAQQEPEEQQQQGSETRPDGHTSRSEKSFPAWLAPNFWINGQIAPMIFVSGRSGRDNFFVQGGSHQYSPIRFLNEAWKGSF